MITIEVDQALTELRATLGQLKPHVMADQIAKALNSAMTKTRRAAYDEIARIYNIRQISDVTSKLKGYKATPGRQEARLFADRRGIQLAYFQPAQETTGKKNISVEVRKGQRKILKSAFFAKANAGKNNELQSLFVRGAYNGRDMDFRTKRLVQYPAPDLPIALLRTTSPLDMLRDPQVETRINSVSEAALIKGLTARVNRLLSKQGAQGD